MFVRILGTPALEPPLASYDSRLLREKSFNARANLCSRVIIIRLQELHRHRGRVSSLAMVTPGGLTGLSNIVQHRQTEKGLTLLYSLLNSTSAVLCQIIQIYIRYYTVIGAFSNPEYIQYLAYKQLNFLNLEIH